MALIGNIVTWIGILMIALITRKKLITIHGQIIEMQESDIHRINELEKKVDAVISRLASLSESEEDCAQNQMNQMIHLQECQDEIKAIYLDEMKKMDNKFRTVNNHCKEIKKDSSQISSQIIDNFSMNTKKTEKFNREQKKSLSNIEELLRLLLVNSLVDDAEEAMKIFHKEKVK